MRSPIALLVAVGSVSGCSAEQDPCACSMPAEETALPGSGHTVRFQAA